MSSIQENSKKSIGWFAQPPKFKIRLLLTIVGVLIQGFGLSWLIRLNLGTDPFSNFVLGCSKLLPFSFGTCQLGINIIMIIYVLIFNRSMIGYGTIANMVFLGYIADFFGWIWDMLLPTGLFDTRWIAYLVLIPAFAFLIVGAATYMSAGLGASPYDGIPFILADQLKKPFKGMRRAWDICFMALGFITGGGVGVVTLAVVFFAGPVITAVKNRIEKFLQ